MHDFGFMTFATNAKYVACAESLARSISISPNTHKRITLVADVSVEHLVDQTLFDNVVFTRLVPVGMNGWFRGYESYAYFNTPYDLTIKLDSDMWIPGSLDHVFDAHKYDDYAVAQHVYTVDGIKIIEDGTSRLAFKYNRLPNVYTAYTVIRKDRDITKDVGHALHYVETHSGLVYDTLVSNCRPSVPSADINLAVALKLLDITPMDTIDSFIHMRMSLHPPAWGKSYDRWTDAMTLDIASNKLMVNNIAVSRPFHYIDKTVIEGNVCF